MYSETIASGDNTDYNPHNHNHTYTYTTAGINNNNYNQHINGDWSGVVYSDNENNEQKIDESTWNGMITIGNIGIDQEKYDNLKKITLDLIRGGFGCSNKVAKEMLKEEIEKYLKVEKKLKKPKEWIDPNLFEI